jgi:hypothetical protein
MLHMLHVAQYGGAAISTCLLSQPCFVMPATLDQQPFIHAYSQSLAELPCQCCHPCLLSTLHAYSQPFMPTLNPSCLFSTLHAYSQPFMPTLNPSCLLSTLHAYSQLLGALPLLPPMPTLNPSCLLSTLHAYSPPFMPTLNSWGPCHCCHPATATRMYGTDPRKGASRLCHRTPGEGQARRASRQPCGDTCWPAARAAAPMRLIPR